MHAAPASPARHWKLGAAGLAAGRIIDAASRWLLLVLLVRRCSASDVGFWGVATAIATPLFTLLELRMRWLSAADGVPRVRLADFLILRLGSVAVAMMAATLLWISVPQRDLAWLIIGVFTAKSVELLSELTKGIAQRHGLTRRVAVGSALRGAAGLAGTLIGMALAPTAWHAVVGLATGWMVVLLLWDIPAVWLHDAARREMRHRASFRRCWRLLRWSAPLAGSAVLVGLGRGLPRFGLMAWHGEELVGVFTAIAGLVGAGDIVVTSMVHAAIAPLGSAAETDRRRFRRITAELVVASAGLGIAGTLLALLAGRHIMAWVYGPQFSGYTLPLVLFSIAMTCAFVNGSLQAALVALRAARRVPPIIAIGTLVGLVTAVLSIPTRPLVGASLTTLGMTGTNCLLLSMVLIKTLRSQRVPRSSPERYLVRLVLAVSPTASSLEQFTRLQQPRWRITLGTYFAPACRVSSGVEWFTGNGRLLPYVRRLAARFRESPVDVLHVHAPHLAPCWLAASLLAGRFDLRKRAVYHIHSCWHHYSFRNRLLCALSSLVSARVICCSRSSHDSLPRPLRWWLGGRLHIVSNGVDFDRTNANRTEPTARVESTTLHAVVVATLRPIKNVETILQAARHVPVDQCRWTIVGGGPQEAELRELTRRWRLGDRVQFTGRLSRDEVLTLLWRSDVLVSASHGEGLPVSVLEAMSAECLIVCSDIPPHREIDPSGELFCFFNQHDPVTLVQAIGRLHRQPLEDRLQTAAKMPGYCRQNFSADSMITACESVYRELTVQRRCA